MRIQPALVALQCVHDALSYACGTEIDTDHVMQERMPEIPKQRAALFGRTAFAGNRQVDESGAKDALEEDNNRLVAELEGKVSVLKHATQFIHDEVSEQNRLLSGMVG